MDHNIFNKSRLLTVAIVLGVIWAGRKYNSDKTADKKILPTIF